MDLDSIRQRLRQFAAVRDWDQFHSPKNLAMALAAEAGELVELFQWLTEDQSRALHESPEELKRVKEEVGDSRNHLTASESSFGTPLPEA